MNLQTDDVVKWYLRELSTIPPLTRDEESTLLLHVRSHDDKAESAARRLLEGNLSLVVSIAERHLSSSVRMLDFVQTGNESLLHALEDFTKESSDSFSVYAAPYIERAILNAIAGESHADK